MNKTTKGAIAASAAALLLLGGWGTQANWSTDDEIPSDTVNTGAIGLEVDCGQWLLDTNEVNLSEIYLLPGDVLSKTCTVTLDLKGLATVELTTDVPTLTSGVSLSGILSANATFTRGGLALSGPTEVADGDVITADLEIELAGDLTGTTGQDLTATLDAITITASQV